VEQAAVIVVQVGERADTPVTAGWVETAQVPHMAELRGQAVVAVAVAVHSFVYQQAQGEEWEY
jgi:hypothetical protein